MLQIIFCSGEFNNCSKWKIGIFIIIVIGIIWLVIHGFKKGNNPDCFNLNYNNSTNTLVQNSSNCKSLKEN